MTTINTPRNHSHSDTTSRGLGELLRPGEPGYDHARAIWNGAIDRRPAFIARCRSVREVVAAVRFGVDNNLLLAVRGGGHSIPGWSVCEGGLMIDLSPMKRIDVDVSRRLATVEPGVLWGEYDGATQAHGLASPGGEISHTGVAGLTLGGGIGWLSRRFGLACDNLVAAEVVLADGSVVVATEDDRPELLWALRGGGGNFGIVTRFTFRVHPVPSMVAGIVMHTAELAPDVLELAESLRRRAPDEVSLTTALVTAPPAPWVPSEYQLRPVVAIAACYVGSVAHGRHALAPLRAFGEPVVDTFGVHRYVDIQRWFDDGVPHGLHYHVRSEWLRPLGRDAVDALVRAGRTRTSPLSQVLIRPMGGAIARVPADSTAFRFREATHLLTLAAAWDPADPDPERHRAWCRDTWTSLRPHSEGGSYVNHLTDEGEARVREAYGEDTWRRLVGIKELYDPDNVFRMNQNITPSGSAARREAAGIELGGVRVERHQEAPGNRR